MSRLTYGDVISRTREKLKAVKQDSFITDRQIWSYYKPWLSQVLKELDSEKKYAIKFFKDSSEAVYEYKLYIRLFDCPNIPHIYYKTDYCIVMDKMESTKF